jgi:hypothetical protein
VYEPLCTYHSQRARPVNITERIGSGRGFLLFMKVVTGPFRAMYQCTGLLPTYGRSRMSVFVIIAGRPLSTYESQHALNPGVYSPLHLHPTVLPGPKLLNLNLQLSFNGNIT